jgi:hypothetical protein
MGDLCMGLILRFCSATPVSTLPTIAWRVVDVTVLDLYGLLRVTLVSLERLHLVGEGTHEFVKSILPCPAVA